MDRKTVKSVGRTPIEFCDLLTTTKTKIHVKKGFTSSELSHLFQQGMVSAELLSGDHVFRVGVRKELEKVDPLHVKLVPETSPNTKDYEVVFAIVDKREIAGWPKTLPFFSQVTLRNCHKYLTSLGYRVGLTRIGIAPLSSPTPIVVRRKKAK